MSAAEDRAETIRLIRDSAAAVAPPRGDLKRIRALRFHAPGFDPATWRQICEFGWPALHLPESEGGSGLGMAEFCALIEALGAGLLPEPLIGAAMAARVLTGAHRAALLSGATLILPAWQERPHSLDPAGETTLENGRISGTKRFVPMASGADAFVVSAREGLALVQAGAPGLRLATEPTQDGGHFGTLHLDHAPAEPIPGRMAEAIEEGSLAVAAYLLGVMERAFALTLDYLKTRQQFGRPIGSFQVLQHRAADLQIQVALSRASIESAAATWDAGGPLPLRRAAVSRAKARAAEAAMLVTRQAIQLHGGIGYTDEYDAGLYLRKAMVLASLHGGADLHRARFAALAPEQDEE